MALLDEEMRLISDTQKETMEVTEKIKAMQALLEYKKKLLALHQELKTLEDASKDIDCQIATVICPPPVPKPNFTASVEKEFDEAHQSSD